MLSTARITGLVIFAELLTPSLTLDRGMPNHKPWTKKKQLVKAVISLYRNIVSVGDHPSNSSVQTLHSL